MAEKTKCEICDRTFKDAESLAMHNKAKHPEELIPKEKKPLPIRKIRNWAIFIVIIGLVGWGVFALISMDSNNQGSPVNIPLGAIIPPGEIHWHPTLEIIIDGQRQTIPKDLGLTGGVHLPIHTHDTTGTLHYENKNPTAFNMRLGYFFENVWKKKFNSTCIFDYCTDKGTLKMFVNEEENVYFDNYIPNDGDKIVIEYTSLEK